MYDLTEDYIKENIADSAIIFQRGVRIYETGAYYCTTFDPDTGKFLYEVNGNYGEYVTQIYFDQMDWEVACDCPYPGNGCKHAVGMLLDLKDRLGAWIDANNTKQEKEEETETGTKLLSRDELKKQVIEDRKKRATSENLKLIQGDTFKGEHLVETERGQQYVITIHDPASGTGHCSCPDFLTNQLGVCKHLFFCGEELKKNKDFEKQVPKEEFPFLDIYWDSISNKPKLFCERKSESFLEILESLSACFDEQGIFLHEDLSLLLPHISELRDNRQVRIQEPVFENLDAFLENKQLQELEAGDFPSTGLIKTKLYPYQEEGVKFGLFKKAVLIGDEMGLGKTLQAITLGVLKKETFGFTKVLVVTLSSLKEQWKREIERFSNETASIVAGSSQQRKKTYMDSGSLFKITNYEAVLRDVTILSRYKPDLVILDEAQRIKNFNTKTADAAKGIPKKHALVLTGTPLENKLEDVYSIVQFLDPQLLAPLWVFTADHFMLSKEKNGKIVGYRNLDLLSQKLKPLVIRRKKAEVLSDLPDEIVNNYYLEMTDEQANIHSGYLQSLLPLLNKKFLTPMDMRRIQELMMKMRMVCDSTYLIDRDTNISPKLKELEGVLEELVIENNRKVVIFSEWTTMTFLIAKHLSKVGISFVELTGKVPVKKRQALIDEFTNNPDCRVFLSTDAGGTGLNLQAGDCVINFELPWNPAKVNQRIGRVSRIGQTSQCINVINFISKDSIEEKILTGIQLKTDLFKGVFEGGNDQVEFSREKKQEMLNQLRQMMGEEPLPPAHESAAPAEIPEDAPGFLNPQVLKDEEEVAETEAFGLSEETDYEEHQTVDRSEDINILANQPVEKVEHVLNNGLQFLGGLMEMATGKKMESVGDDQKMIHIDRATGEVTMKFKLPGF
ncbi:MAG: DEAD/DEAH box helicase [SAR324 cluster bacterium]|nr:DEAD/DEAH box helicase [SAR324 cluster bacterium]